jgi:hypothetical protein
MSRGCIGEPISWLELERHALGESAQAALIDRHLLECASCEGVAKSIELDARRMPALLVPLSPPRRSSPRWFWLFALLPAAALLLLWLRVPQIDERAKDGFGTKGGDATMLLIRERDGVLLEPTHFSPGDRFKVEVSCAPGLHQMRVTITQEGQTFSPLPTSKLQCSNQTVLPGAFSLDGGLARVCLTIGDQGDPLCVLVEPEP